MIHGLQPGMALFTTQAETVYPIIFGFILSGILLLPVGMILARCVTMIAKIPIAVLCPLITVLSILGAYSISNRVFDIYIVVLFGIIGYFIRKAGYPLSGFVLGMLLGNMAEMGLTRTITLSRGHVISYFLHRPICVGLGLILLMSMGYPAVKTFLGRKSGH